MTYRGIVRNGRILVDIDDLPDGTSVEITPIKRPSSKKSKKKKATSRRRKPLSGSARRKKKDPFESIFGIWKDRPDWKGKSSLEILAELRAKSLGRLPRG